MYGSIGYIQLPDSVMVGSKNCHREHDIAWHEEKNSTYINSFDRFKWLHTQMYVKVKNSRTIPTRQAYYVFQTFLMTFIINDLTFLVSVG